MTSGLATADSGATWLSAAGRTLHKAWTPAAFSEWVYTLWLAFCFDLTINLAAGLSYYKYRELLHSQLWADPGVKSEICVPELISPKKNKKN